MAEYLNRAVILAKDVALASAQISEDLMENVKDLNFEILGNLYDEAENKMDSINKELNSSYDKEKLEALNRLIVLIAKGVDVSSFFAQVVKNIESGNNEVRRKVYVYLLEYAERQQDLALLSINTFQKDMSDKDPIIRALALQVLSEIRIKAISTVVVLSVRRGSKDSSPYVRRVAALSALTVYQRDYETKEELQEIIMEMMDERSNIAFGSVMRAFMVICSSDLELGYNDYIKCCEMLIDLDAWGQLTLLDIIMRYSASFLSASNIKREKDKEYLIEKIKLLFFSTSNAVVMAAVSALARLMDKESLENVIWNPIMRIMNVNEGVVKENVLFEMLSLTNRLPGIFQGKSGMFCIACSDSEKVAEYKLKLIARVITEDTSLGMLSELEKYASILGDDNVAVLFETVLVCTIKSGRHRNRYIGMILGMLESSRDSVVNGSAKALIGLVSISEDRTDIFSDKSRQVYEITCLLARRIKQIKGDEVRSMIYRLVANKFEGIGTYATYVMKYGILNFKNEKVMAKREILTLCTVLKAKDDMTRESNEMHSTMTELYEYVFTLARYDVEYSVRDWARSLKGIISMAEQQRETQSKESGGNSSNTSSKTMDKNLFNSITGLGRDYDESSKAFNDELETDNLKLSFDKLSVNSEGLGSTRAYKGRTTGARSTSKANYRVGGGQEDWGGSMEDYEGDIPMTVPLVLSPQSPPTGTVFDNSSNTKDHGYLNNHGEIDEKEESEDELEAFLNKSDSPKEHSMIKQNQNAILEEMMRRNTVYVYNKELEDIRYSSSSSSSGSGSSDDYSDNSDDNDNDKDSERNKHDNRNTHDHNSGSSKRNSYNKDTENTGKAEVDPWKHTTYPYGNEFRENWD